MIPPHIPTISRQGIDIYSTAIEFYLPVTIVIIPDVLVTNPITMLYKSCLLAMASQTMLAGMEFSITGTPNSHEARVLIFFALF